MPARRCCRRARHRRVERLGATLVLSVLVHAMIILGIGFAVEDAAPMMPTLDVILTAPSRR